jgi:hypothetical protein
MDWSNLSNLSFLRESVSSAAQPLLQLSSFFSCNQQVAPSVDHEEPGGAMVPLQLIEELEDNDEAEEQAARSLSESSEGKKRARVAETPEAAIGLEAMNSPAEPKRSRQGEVVDVTDMLMLPQSEAAARVGMTVSTFCKRWKDSVKERKWPYRSVQKLDKEVAALQKRNPMTNAVELKIARMLKEREALLAPGSIRL